MIRTNVEASVKPWELRDKQGDLGEAISKEQGAVSAPLQRESSMKVNRRAMASIVLGCAMLGGGLGIAGAGAQQPAGDPTAGLGQMLIQGLKDTPGCLGADAGQMQSGKNCIVGWFEDKEAVKRWYSSPAHQGIMRRVVTQGVEHEALAHVPDGTGPIMVIASITFSDAPKFEAIRMPISQIAIELFAPLPGGAHLGGRLSPEGFKVEHMRDYTPAPAAGASAGG